ncbi:MAG: hypothetical protein OJF51_000943 [Nitrospira sp.]|nr:MAG: hypothetical protein OJF51_000943 [Nitrospira sp.]
MLNESVLLPNTTFEERTLPRLICFFWRKTRQKVSKYPTKLRDESSKIS